jgi:asparagine N-glycosylation enzyme membrane subunit Stt3
MIYILSTVLVIGLLAGCGTGSDTKGSADGSTTEKSEQNGKPTEKPDENEIAAKFHTTIETKEENEKIIIIYRVKNLSGKTQKLTFPSGLEADYIVYDQDGKKIKQYSDDVMSTQAIKELMLENNQEITKEFTISELPIGNYKIEVFLTAKEEEARVVTDLIVKNSLSKGTGVLVGQMDPHSIEVDINGKTVAFQLSEEAQQQYPSLKEGGQISFLYKENKSGQKTIEKFLLVNE